MNFFFKESMFFRPLVTLAKDVVFKHENYYIHQLTATYEIRHS